MKHYELLLLLAIHIITVDLFISKHRHFKTCVHLLPKYDTSVNGAAIPCDTLRLISIRQQQHPFQRPIVHNTTFRPGPAYDQEWMDDSSITDMESNLEEIATE